MPESVADGKPDGDTLSENKARSFILNDEMVDTSKNGAISRDEWQKGFNMGCVSADANTARDMQSKSGSSSSGFLQERL